MTRRYITIAEAAEYLKISDHTVRRLIADGELTGYRIGRSNRMIRVDLDEIDEGLMRPFGGVVWRENPSGVTPRSRARLGNSQIKQRSQRASRDLSEAEVVATVRANLGNPPKWDPLDQTYWRYCSECGHPAVCHNDGMGAAPATGRCVATIWGPRPSRPCECREFVENLKKRRRRRRSS